MRSFPLSLLFQNNTTGKEAHTRAKEPSMEYCCDNNETNRGYGGMNFGAVCVMVNIFVSQPD